MSMKIKSSEFIKSAVKPEGYPELGLPEVAFVGRSNVGKSSLINRLLNRRSLAKTSSTPGKTRLINFFLINRDMVFVDLPGYGYASVSKKERESWRPMMERYFSGREELKGVIVLQDIRRDQTEADRSMIDLMRRNNIPVVLVLTKADKFSRNQRIKRIGEIKKKRGEPDFNPICFSTSAGMGVDELWNAICGLAFDEKG